MKREAIELTNLSSTDGDSLFERQGIIARRSLQKLDKSIGLLDRYLGQLAMFVEDVKKIPFRYLLCW